MKIQWPNSLFRFIFYQHCCNFENLNDLNPFFIYIFVRNKTQTDDCRNKIQEPVLVQRRSGIQF